MDVLTALASEHDKWKSVVYVLGCPKEYVEDVIHDTYIKLATMDNPEKIMFNETEVNHWYVILALRSTCYDFMKSLGRIKSFEFPMEDYHEDVEYDQEDAFDRLYERIIAETNDFGRYGSKLSQMYFKTDLSMRDVSEMSNISLTSIFHSIKKYRVHLKEKFGEDYEDYMNGDYDKV